MITHNRDNILKFDYLVIGAGTAGCVLANRLSENTQNKVAIFEVGHESDILEGKHATCNSVCYA